MMEPAAPELDFGAADLAGEIVAQNVENWPAYRRVSLAAAFGLHAALIAASLVTAGAPEIGAGGHELDAIGVEIVSATVLMAREQGAGDRAAAAPEMSERIGSADDDAVPSAAEHKPPPEVRRERPPEPPEPAAELAETPDPARDAGKIEPPHQDNATAATADGGAIAEGTSAPKAASAPVRTAAQAGAVGRFVSDLRLRLARSKPRGLRTSGVVVVTFALLPSGELDYAHVAKSSGKPQLDEAALAGVRRAAPFPRPPASMQRSELVFSVPYQFE